MFLRGGGGACYQCCKLRAAHRKDVRDRPRGSGGPADLAGLLVEPGAAPADDVPIGGPPGPPGGGDDGGPAARRKLKLAANVMFFIDSHP
jgi:hypothetical protein